MSNKDYRVVELEEQLAQAERDGEEFCQRIGELKATLKLIAAPGCLTKQPQGPAMDKGAIWEPCGDCPACIAGAALSAAEQDERAGTQ